MEINAYTVHVYSKSDDWMTLRVIAQDRHEAERAALAYSEYYSSRAEIEEEFEPWPKEIERYARGLIWDVQRQAYINPAPPIYRWGELTSDQDDYTYRNKEAYMKYMLEHVVAILTSTVCPIDGQYEVKTLETHPDRLDGIPHYIGHPSTKEIIESMGAVKAISNLFGGLQPGQCALVVSIRQGKSSRAEKGMTVDQEVTLHDLTFRIMKRVS